eukprot:CAMPEP_0175124246 /NCGR_PEP_ID=MMETSP0087-20121206/2676_1 /TAXON_ID=136419 /ORGANISM="Unknown Unknown, Strain D1" /LENGTH=253 /DNA_ID=CAMNT_0016405995 /DNA_START=505 /DNA_END=1267 /DNA_ORIENTATION=+
MTIAMGCLSLTAPMTLPPLIDGSRIRRPRHLTHSTATTNKIARAVRGTALLRIAGVAAGVAPVAGARAVPTFTATSFPALLMPSVVPTRVVKAMATATVAANWRVVPIQSIVLQLSLSVSLSSSSSSSPSSSSKEEERGGVPVRRQEQEDLAEQRNSKSPDLVLLAKQLLQLLREGAEEDADEGSGCEEEEISPVLDTWNDPLTSDTSTKSLLLRRLVVTLTVVFGRESHHTQWLSDPMTSANHPAFFCWNTR